MHELTQFPLPYIYEMRACPRISGYVRLDRYQLYGICYRLPGPSLAEPDPHANGGLGTYAIISRAKGMQLKARKK